LFLASCNKYRALTRFAYPLKYFIVKVFTIMALIKKDIPFRACFWVFRARGQ
jgi:hypothetical protein